ncbi:MAG: hypothetical protein ACKVKF_26360, partial [Rhodobacterales bacterium]
MANKRLQPKVVSPENVVSPQNVVTPEGIALIEAVLRSRSRNKEYLANLAGFEPGEVSLETNQDREAIVLRGHEEWVRTAAFSPD